MPHEHRRRVQVTGGGTFIVSLPKPWATRHRLQAGDEVGVLVQDDGGLRVLPPAVRRPSPRKASIDAEKLSAEALVRRLIGAYLSGIDVIEVHHRPQFSRAQRDSIRRFSRICAGPEIMEETADRVMLRDLVDAREVTPHGALRRIFLMAHAMVQDAVRALEGPEAALAQDVQGRDDDVDRLYRLVSKRFARSLLGDDAEPPPGGLYEGLRLLLASRILERCADHADRVAGHSLDLADSPVPAATRKSLVGFGHAAHALMQRAFDAFTNSSHAEADSVIAESNRLTARKPKLLADAARLDPTNIVGLSLVLESIERVHQYASDIAELALNDWGTPAGPQQGATRRAAKSS